MEPLYENAPESEMLIYLKEHSRVLFMFAFVFQGLTLSTLLYLSVKQPIPNMEYFWIALAIKITCIGLTMYFCGRAVEKSLLKVSYSRKIVHLIFFLSSAVDVFLPGIEEKFKWVIACWNVHVVIWILLLITKPVRTRYEVIQTMYSSSNRLSDRGLTQIYAFVQIISSIVIISSFTLVFETMNISGKMIFIPILSVALGDGMAEVVAQICQDYKICGGPHQYTTTGCCSGDRKFVRSFEGSATVFIGTLLSTLIAYNESKEDQFTFIICVLPLTMAFMEAKAPHSLDNPFLLAWGYFVILISTTL